MTDGRAYDIREFRGDAGYYRSEQGKTDEDSTDAFGKKIADITTTVADLPSHYPFNPQRHRLYVDGIRQFVKYGEATSLLNDQRDVYNLTPSANSRVKFQTAERFRYVVQTIMNWSAALNTNRELQGDEKIQLIFEGRRDSTDNLKPLDYHGIEFTANGTNLVENRGSTRLTEKSIELAKPLTEWNRYENRFSWYNVGNREVRQTYTTNGKQYNPLIGRSSVDGERGEQVANGRITVEIITGSQSDLEVNIGSMAAVAWGNTTVKAKKKSNVLDGLTHSGSGEFEPLFAIRTSNDDKFDQVTMGLISLNIIAAPGNGFATAQIVDPSKTDASGFSGSPSHGDLASATEVTESVTTFPDSTGSVVSSAADIGGYQISTSISDVDGSKDANVTRNTGREQRSQINNSDIAVVLVRTDKAGDFRISYTTEQEW